MNDTTPRIGVIGIGWLVKNQSEQTPTVITPVLATITQSQGSAMLNSNAVASNETIHRGDVLHETKQVSACRN